MKRLFLVLALIVFLTVPVCAYNLVNEFTNLPITSTYNTGSNVYWHASSIYNATMIHVVTRGLKGAGLQSFSDVACHITKAQNPYPQVGDAVVSLSSSEYNATYNDYDITFELYNYTGAESQSYGFSFDWCNGLNRHWFEVDGSNTAAWMEGAEGCDPSLPNQFCFSDGAGHMMGGTMSVYNGSAVIAPVASFSCTPTSQFPDTDVVCTDTSTNTPTDWYWTIDAEALGIKGWKTNTTQNFTWQSAYTGLYSVNLQVNNSAGSDWENKTNYVSISENATPNTCNIPPLAGYSRTSFQCTDAISSGKINGCNIQLHDLEGGAWSNMTNTDGTWCIDTLPAHHINGYGQSTGYTDGSRLNVQEWNGQTYTILMIPGYVPPPAMGYVWVYVHVTEFATATDLSGVTVSIQGTGLSTVSGVTDNSGVVHLQWPNATEAYINSAKPGYSTAMDVITTSDFGPDTVHVELHRGVHTMTIVPTTGPGGTVPTTVNPYGTPGPGGTMPAGYTNNQGQMMMDYLAANGLMLIQLCVFVTIAALLGFKFGK